MLKRSQGKELSVSWSQNLRLEQVLEQVIFEFTDFISQHLQFELLFESKLVGKLHGLFLRLLEGKRTWKSVLNGVHIVKLYGLEKTFCNKLSD